MLILWSTYRCPRIHSENIQQIKFALGPATLFVRPLNRVAHQLVANPYYNWRPLAICINVLVGD